jgi:hypothetical protein
MMSALRRLFGCTTATAAVEAAIFTPFFLTLTLGVTDLGSGMFVQMTVNAAAQAGAAYAVKNCTSLTAACLTNIKTAMNDATGNSSFCTVATCTPSMTSCPDGSPKCITVSANCPFSPILPVTSGSFSHSWTQAQTYSSTIIIRVL